MKRDEAAGKFALLGILSLCPGSGYDIKKMVESSIGYFWSESYGRIYPLLEQLMKEGLIRRQRNTLPAAATGNPTPSRGKGAERWRTGCAEDHVWNQTAANCS